MKTKVTIGVCVKDCEKDVSQIVERISSQDFPHEQMEVLFVEDGSTDNTLKSILKYAPKMNMKYRIPPHESKGLGFSRNFVFKNARSDYIIWVDDGTVIHKDYVRKQVDFMNKHPDAGIAIGIMDFFPGSNRVATLENIGEIVFNYKFRGKVTTKLPATGGSIYRIKALEQTGGFDEGIQGATEDTEAAYRIKSAGWQIYVTEARYYRDINKKLKKVWNKNVWYGYGSHFTLHKHKELHQMLYKSTPLAGFVEGIPACSIAYKLTHNRSSFLLPLYFSIKRTAWCVGYMKSHFDSYGHA